MIKRLVLKSMILIIMVVLLLSFNWETKSLDPVKNLVYFGVAPVNNLSDLKDYPTKNGQTIIQVNDVLVANYEDFQIIDNYVSSDDIPAYLKQAIVAVEDSRFYSHEGFDYFGIIRAVAVNFQSKEYREGGSTITQQLVKNMFLTPEKKLERKIEEVLISTTMEKEFSKEQILEMYLNQIYFGPNVYGVGAASQEFFGKAVSELTLAECALLAGIPRNPGAYSPTRNFEEAKKRQEVVLNRMLKQGFISSKEKEKAMGENIIVRKDR